MNVQSKLGKWGNGTDGKMGEGGAIDGEKLERRIGNENGIGGWSACVSMCCEDGCCGNFKNLCGALGTTANHHTTHPISSSSKTHK